MEKSKQTKNRIFFKTILYRLISIIIAFCISYIWTKQFEASLYLTLFIELVQTISYFIYENLWNQVGWGIIIEHGF